MTIRRAFWGLLILLGLAGLAVVVPQSPVYLPKLLNWSGRHHGQSVGHWMDAVQGPTQEGRKKAIFALGAIGAEAEAAVPLLAKLLVEDPDREVRNEAALALSKMDPASRAAVPALTTALADTELFVRMNALRALFRLKAEAHPAIPAIQKVIQDPTSKTNLATFHNTIEEMACLTLGRASAGTADGLACLTAVLESARTPQTRSTAAWALGEIGAEARPTAPQLRKLLKDQNDTVRLAAQEALQSIGAE